MSARDQILPQKPVRLGVRCVDFPLLSAAYYLALLIVYHQTREVRARGGVGGGVGGGGGIAAAGDCSGGEKG